MGVRRHVPSRAPNRVNRTEASEGLRLTARPPPASDPLRSTGTPRQRGWGAVLLSLAAVVPRRNKGAAARVQGNHLRGAPVGLVIPPEGRFADQSQCVRAAHRAVIDGRRGRRRRLVTDGGAVEGAA